MISELLKNYVFHVLKITCFGFLTTSQITNEIWRLTGYDLFRSIQFSDKVELLSGND